MSRLAPEWLAPSRTALLLIDLQADFGAPGGQMALRGMDMTAPQAAVAKAGELAHAARIARAPLVFVRLLTHPGGETPILREAKARRGDDTPDLCREGTAGAAFIGPQPRNDEMVISKTRYSAFAHTGLAERLKALGLDTLILAGLTTECCVAASAWHAFEQDFHVFVAADACAAYDAALHQNALKALELSGATVATTADYVRAWG